MEFDFREGDRCLSFDVVSLFTNVPLEDTIHLIANELYSDKATKPPIKSKASFIELLKCATSGMFTHRGELYQQINGVSMGNPLAPTFANFFLGYLETNQLFNVDTTNDECNPALYVRYVDDVFCLFRKGVGHEEFMSRLNNLHADISFTVEIGGKVLPFLDTKIELTDNGFTSTVFRKSTNTDVILNYSSVAPTKWKTGLIKCLIHRANRICSTKPLLRKEIDHLRSMFYRNGYPKRLFDQIVEEYWEKQEAKTPDPVDQKPTIDEAIKPMLKIPYIGSRSVAFSKRIKNLVKSEMNLDVQTVYETVRIKDQFRLKDAVAKEILSKVVYRFSCSSDSRIQYIGYTNRTLRERVKEHLGGTTAISDHIGTCTRCVN